MMNADHETISMRRDTLLVIFDFPAHSYEEWRKTGQKPDDTFALCNPDTGERIALWRLEGAIERTLPEIFAPEYKELIAAEKQRLIDESGSVSASS
jgi:hypothetical protein